MDSLALAARAQLGPASVFEFGKRLGVRGQLTLRRPSLLRQTAQRFAHGPEAPRDIAVISDRLRRPVVATLKKPPGRRVQMRRGRNINDHFRAPFRIHEADVLPHARN
jgi:hypothetical protein